MEEKKEIKVSLTTFFLILAIIIILVMGMFIYKLSNEKTEETNKTSELQTRVNSLNNTIGDLQEKIDNISENINSNNSVENTSNTNNTNTSTNTTTTTNNNNNNKSNSFTDKEVKKAFSDYLELGANAGCDNLLEALTEKGKLNYRPSKDTILDDGTVITTIKFSDYKKAMLNYVSESEFEKYWTSKQYFGKNSKGYLTKVQGGGGLRAYTINSIKKIDDSTYTAKTTSIVVDGDDDKENESFTFKVTSYKGKCVIDSVK